MAVQIQLRRGTAAGWTSADPTLSQGEIGLETDTDRAKIGDGSTAWISLPYAFETGVGAGHVIAEAGSDMTARGTLNFLAGFDLTDDSGNDETEVALDASEVSGAPVSTDIADSQVTGTASTFANSDHQHAHPAPGANYPQDSVIGTEADGTAITPARSDHAHSITAPGAGYPLDVATSEADGTSANPARADHVHGHGTGYLPDAHHARAHDHSNASDTTALVPESLEITGGPFALRGDITPAQLTANTDDYAPASLADATALRLSTDASRNLTGLTGGADGRVMLLVNVGSFPLIVKHDVTSTAANRFYCPGNLDVNLTTGAGCWMWYDSTVSRWRIVQIVALGTDVAQPIGTAVAGTSVLASHQDHVHATGASTPSTQAFSDSAVVGTGPAAAMTDHKHAMMVNPLTAHTADHPGAPTPDVQTFTADGTWTKPSGTGYTHAYITAIGGGGSGRGTGAGGGGGGAAVSTTFLLQSLPSSLAVVIGQGGSGAGTGVDGGDTYIGSFATPHVRAKGGRKGAVPTGGAGGEAGNCIPVADAISGGYGGEQNNPAQAGESTLAAGGGGGSGSGDEVHGASGGAGAAGPGGTEDASEPANGTSGTSAATGKPLGGGGGGGAETETGGGGTGGNGGHGGLYGGGGGGGGDTTSIGGDGADGILVVTCTGGVAPPGITEVKKAADESITSSVTLQDDNDLLFSYEASKTYFLDITLFVQMHTDYGLKIKFEATGTGSPTLNWAMPEMGGTQSWGSTSAGSYATTWQTLALTDTGGILPHDIGTADIHIVSIRGRLVAGTGTGVFKLTWAQQVSGGTATILKKGSYMAINKID